MRENNCNCAGQCTGACGKKAYSTKSVEKPDALPKPCDFFPEWVEPCLGDACRKPYKKGQCVTVCRKTATGTIKEVWQSRHNDNYDYPPDTRMTDEDPAWILRDNCAAWQLPPIVKGANITTTVDELTGQVCYLFNTIDADTTYELDTQDECQVLIGRDRDGKVVSTQTLQKFTPIPNTDRTCRMTALLDQTTQVTTLSETCYDKDDNIVSGPTVIQTFPPGIVTIINNINENTTDGTITFTKPDMTMICSYNKDYINDLECRLCDWTFPSNNDVQGDGSNNPTLIDWTYGTISEALGDDPLKGLTAWQEVLPVGSTVPSPSPPNSVGPYITKEVTITRDMLEGWGMPSCHNTALISIRGIANVDDREGDGNNVHSQVVIIAKGCNQIGAGSDIFNPDEAGSDLAPVREHIPITLDPVTDSFTIRQQVNFSSHEDRYELATFRSVSKLYGSKYSKCGS